MAQDPCVSFRAALAAHLSGSGAGEFPLEDARHLDGCEACQEQLDGLEKPSDESDEEMLARIMPIMDALAQLEAESEPSPERLAMLEEREAGKRELDEAVRGLIVRHPDLEPAKHGIDMERYGYGAFFIALHAVNMLMNRLCRRGDPLPKSFGLRENGTIFLDGDERVPAASVQREINRSIVDGRKDDVTEDSWYDQGTCAKFAGWIVAAVRRKPDLMRNYRMIGVDANDPRIITLEPIRTKGPGDRDPLDLWK